MARDLNKFVAFADASGAATELQLAVFCADPEHACEGHRYERHRDARPSSGGEAA